MLTRVLWRALLPACAGLLCAGEAPGGGSFQTPEVDSPGFLRAATAGATAGAGLFDTPRTLARDGVARPASLPALETRPGDPLSARDRDALIDYALARPEVAGRLAGRRVRVLRMGLDSPKDADGREYRRATLFIRNYDEGLTERVFIRLDDGATTLEDLTAWVQPSPGEIAAALAILGRDRTLAPLLNDPGLFVTGGFMARAEDPKDPCHRDICLHIEIMTADRKGFAARAVVNLTREKVANRDFRASTDPRRPAAMTAPKGGK